MPVDHTMLTDAYSLRQNPYGEPYYWLTGRVSPRDPALKTDRVMVKKGYVTVTPLEYHRTNRTAIETLELAFEDANRKKPLPCENVDSPSHPFVCESADKLPELPAALDELFEQDCAPDSPQQIRREDTTDYDISSKPPKGNAKGMTSKPSPYSEGT